MGFPKSFRVRMTEPGSRGADGECQLQRLEGHCLVGRRRGHKWSTSDALGKQMVMGLHHKDMRVS